MTIDEMIKYCKDPDMSHGNCSEMDDIADKLRELEADCGQKLAVMELMAEQYNKLKAKVKAADAFFDAWETDGSQNLVGLHRAYRNAGKG